MQEYERNVLEQYDIEVSSTRKTRGAVLCDTNKGLLLLKEVKVSSKRIPAMSELYQYLWEQGVEYTDRILLTKEDEPFVTLEDGSRYIVKQWFEGRECDVRRPAEILAAARLLAKLHDTLRHEMSASVSPGTNLKEEYRRHNQELKKVRKYMRGVTPKGEFEFAFLKYFEQMYQWADVAVAELAASGYDQLYQESIDQSCLTHGEYNYHNILILLGEYQYKRDPYKIAVTNFEKFKRDVQVEDLYYFLRKVMEKNGWKMRLGDSMLNAYSAVRPLTEAEIEYLKIRLIYPEKFWKVANSYYHSNKAWIPEKKIEKLDIAIRQTKEKKRFLEDIFSFHL